MNVFVDICAGRSAAMPRIAFSDRLLGEDWIIPWVFCHERFVEKSQESPIVWHLLDFGSHTLS